MSFAVVLFIVFLVLKLVGVITWSWWFVTMPLWIGLAIVAALWLLGAIFVGGTVGVLSIFDRRARKKRSRQDAMRRHPSNGALRFR